MPEKSSRAGDADPALWDETVAAL
jgi:hypothetical protein